MDKTPDNLRIIREKLVEFQLDPADKGSSEFFYKQYKKLVYKVAHMYKGRALWEDITQSGFEGLYHGLHEFDTSQNIKGLFRYLKRTIADHIKGLLRGFVIKIGTQQSIALSEVKKYAEENNCTFDQAITAMGFSERKAKNLRKAAGVAATASLTTELFDTLYQGDSCDPTVTSIIEKEEKAIVNSRFARLDDEQKRVVMLKMDGKTFKEIAAEIKKSTATANNRYRQAIAILGITE